MTIEHSDLQSFYWQDIPDLFPFNCKSRTGSVAGCLLGGNSVQRAAAEGLKSEGEQGGKWLKGGGEKRLGERYSKRLEERGGGRGCWEEAGVAAGGTGRIELVVGGGRDATRGNPEEQGVLHRGRNPPGRLLFSL